MLEAADTPANLWGVERGDEAHLVKLAAVGREAALLSDLDHPNIVKLIGVTTDGHGCVTRLIMEHAGGTLRSLCLQVGVGTNSRPGLGVGLTLDVLLLLMSGGAHSLRYLHALTPPVFHRDLKDDNFLLFYDDDGAVFAIKLADVGEAKVRVGRVLPRPVHFRDLSSLVSVTAR